MASSYILNKDEFKVLFKLINGADAAVPEGYSDVSTAADTEGILDGLAKKGYIYKADKRIDVERTVLFLIKQMSMSRRTAAEKDGKRLIMYCPKLIVVLEDDRFSDKKCRITPIKDEEMLTEFRLENEIDHDESGDDE